jgi:ABC-2 type transport system permease protein
MRAPLGAHLFWMTLRQSWKGLLVFGAILLFITWGMCLVYPEFLDMQEADLSEAQGIRLEWANEKEGLINLTWKAVPKAVNYTVLENNQSFDISTIISLIGGGGTNLSVQVAYHGTGTSLERTVDTNQTWYYTVLIYLADGNMTGTGVVTTKDIGKTIYEVMMENPSYAALTGGREINIFSFPGFVDIELLSYWALMIGFYAAYVGVGAVSRDVERKTMDILLSTPVSRRRLLLERGAAVAAMMLVLSLLGGLGVIIGGHQAGVDVAAGHVMAAFIGCWPMLVVISSISMTLSVVMNDQKAAMGLSFAVVLVSYVLSYAAYLTEGLRPLRWVTPMGYYDHTGLILGDWTRWGDVGVLFATAAAIMLLAVWLFQRKELPT